MLRPTRAARNVPWHRAGAPASGPGSMPRFGSGWMHQFGHVYALQKELLNPHRDDWFRALELWHTGRHVGVAFNAAHYRMIAKQLVALPTTTPGAAEAASTATPTTAAAPAAVARGERRRKTAAAPWHVGLRVLAQMQRDAVRPDVVTVGCVLASCADHARWAEALSVVAKYAGDKKQRLDEQCRRAAAVACARAGRNEAEAILQLSHVMALPPPAPAVSAEAGALAPPDEAERVAVVAHRRQRERLRRAAIPDSKCL